MPPREWDAASYDRVSDPQLTWARDVIDRLDLRGDERVLDAGCGSGRVTEELLSRVPKGQVVAVDGSAAMIQQLQRRLGDRVEAFAVDLLDLAVTQPFDAIFSTATFHWIRDHNRLFGELRRALRAGGRLEAQCGGGPNLATIHARADELAATEPFHDSFAQWEEPWLFASPEETTSRLARAGFTEIECWLEQAPARFSDAERFGAFVESVVMRPYLARLSDPARRREFLDAIVALAARDNPAFTLDYWRLNISAATM